jgi:8-oxo-dGTP diphosphatase
MPGESTAATVVEAAGGVVIAAAAGHTGALRVLIVHRPRYDDWSLPKGHVDPGEAPVDTALREVLEETGVRAESLAPLGTTQHRLTHGTKRVHWFLMRPIDEQDRIDAHVPHAQDAEVDDARWCEIDEAARLLSYTSELDLLRRALEAS